MQGFDQVDTIGSAAIHFFFLLDTFQEEEKYIQRHNGRYHIMYEMKTDFWICSAMLQMQEQYINGRFSG